MSSIANLLALLSSFVYTAIPDEDQTERRSETGGQHGIDRVLVTAGLSTVIQDFQKRRDVGLELTDLGRDYVRAYSLFAIMNARTADGTGSGIDAILARAERGGAAWLRSHDARQQLAEIREDRLDPYSFSIRLYSQEGMFVQSRDDLVASCAFDLNNVIDDWMRNQGLAGSR